MRRIRPCTLSISEARSTETSGFEFGPRGVWAVAVAIATAAKAPVQRIADRRSAFIAIQASCWSCTLILYATVDAAPSECHQRIDRRSGAAFDRQRRERDHKLVAVQPASSCSQFLEVEALHDVDPHPDQCRHVDRI